MLRPQESVFELAGSSTATSLSRFPHFLPFTLMSNSVEPAVYCHICVIHAYGGEEKKMGNLLYSLQKITL